MWQFFREHTNPSNDCKSVVGVCKHLWGGQPWGTLGTSKWHVGSIWMQWLLPTRSGQAASMPQLCRCVPSITEAQLGCASQHLPYGEDFGSSCIDSLIKL